MGNAPGGPVAVEYEIRPEDREVYYRRYADRSAFGRETMKKQRLIAIACWVLCGGGLALEFHWWPLFGIGCIVGCGLFMFYPGNFRYRMVRNMRRIAELRGAVCRDHAHRLEVLQSGLRSVCPSVDATFPWSTVAAMEFEDDRVIVFFRGDSGLVVSRQAIIGGDYDELQAALAAYDPEREPSAER